MTEATWTANPDSAEAYEMQEVKKSLSMLEQAVETNQTTSKGKSSGSGKGKGKARSRINSGSSSKPSTPCGTPKKSTLTKVSQAATTSTDEMAAPPVLPVEAPRTEKRALPAAQTQAIDVDPVAA